MGGIQEPKVDSVDKFSQDSMPNNKMAKSSYFLFVNLVTCDSDFLRSNIQI
jgi:hypothetical protein